MKGTKVATLGEDGDMPKREISALWRIFDNLNPFIMVRFLMPVSVLLTFALFFAACEKETSQENIGDNQQNTAAQGTTSGTAAFVVSGTPGPCTTPTVSGTYKAGTALDGTNTVTVLVNVTSTGTYSISTAITNGIYFAASGDFTTTGLQSVVLQGQGIPISTGTYNYMAGANSCTFPIVVESGGGVTTNCKACVYIPMCDGSVYTYVDTTTSGVTTTNQNVTFVSDTLIDGTVYQKFIVTGSPNNPYYNCTAGVTNIVSLNVTSSGVVVPRVDQTLLKANSPVGTTWQNSLVVSGVSIVYDWSIAEKGISRTVLGNTYPDVIRVHLSVSANVPGVGLIPSSEADYYYAKNVGLIETENIDVSSGMPMQTLHRVLQAYSIP